MADGKPQRSQSRQKPRVVGFRLTEAEYQSLKGWGESKGRSPAQQAATIVRHNLSQREGSAQPRTGVVQKATRRRPSESREGRPSSAIHEGGGSISIPRSALGPVEPRLVDRPRTQVEPDWKGGKH